MAVKIEVSQVIDRPVAKVFHFYAHEHVRNHPRWDPDLELEQVSDGPIEVGTLIRRRNIRYGAPVEEMMEVVEFEPNRALATVIHGGPVEFYGRVSSEAVGPDRTTLTICAEMPGLDESMESFLKSRIERSAQNIKRLIESEVEK